LLCGSISDRERPWASKRQPIDFKRCCADRLNAQAVNCTCRKYCLSDVFDAVDGGPLKPMK
jgi:hypothetical protein